MITIGLMTGNSLDGVDAVMTDFGCGNIRDISFMSVPYSARLKKHMLELRKEILQFNSDMDKAFKTDLFKKTLKEYSDVCGITVENLIKQAGVAREKIAAIGISGQSTGAHNPPSVAGKTQPFTTQIFQPAKLAKATGIPVVYDIRSDDIFNGGEGAPLAPMHHLHLSKALVKKGYSSVCFINGGNTANLTVVNNKNQVMGFDCGAFNHYIDALAQELFQKDFDENGVLGAQGQINPQLLNELYSKSALTAEGINFYDMIPPKSSGPHLYNMLEKLKSYQLPAKDVLRNVEYFAAYSVFMNLRFIPQNFDFPECFLVFGGGWKNPLVFADFDKLLHKKGLVLPQHKIFAKNILKRINSKSVMLDFSDAVGISGQYMEARIMADMAYCYLKKIPFTKPEITGCRKSCISGVICLPGENLRKTGRGFTYSRAAKGWL